MGKTELICVDCGDRGFNHPRLRMAYCHHTGAVRIYNGRWRVYEQCTQTEARRLCVDASLGLWDTLATYTQGFSRAKRGAGIILDELLAFLEGLREDVV